MHLKEEFAFPVSLCHQKNLSKKASSAADTKTRSEDVLFHLTVTCSKSAIESLEKRVTYVQS